MGLTNGADDYVTKPFRCVIQIRALTSHFAVTMWAHMCVCVCECVCLCVCVCVCMCVATEYHAN
jgi:hypothetical protein